ncbi:MAG: hypothetical protein AAFY26_12015 [Cyanobacteria bacterium J06638_22]
MNQKSNLLPTYLLCKPAIAIALVAVILGLAGNTPTGAVANSAVLVNCWMKL